MERNKICIIIKSNYKDNKEQRVVIECVDNTDFCTDIEKNEIKIQEIVSYYVKIFETTGGKVKK